MSVEDETVDEGACDRHVNVLDIIISDGYLLIISYPVVPLCFHSPSFITFYVHMGRNCLHPLKMYFNVM